MFLFIVDKLKGRRWRQTDVTPVKRNLVPLPSLILVSKRDKQSRWILRSVSSCPTNVVGYWSYWIEFLNFFIQSLSFKIWLELLKCSVDYKSVSDLCCFLCWTDMKVRSGMVLHTVMLSNQDIFDLTRFLMPFTGPVCSYPSVLSQLFLVLSMVVGFNMVICNWW